MHFQTLLPLFLLISWLCKLFPRSFCEWQWRPWHVRTYPIILHSCCYLLKKQGANFKNRYTQLLSCDLRDWKSCKNSLSWFSSNRIVGICAYAWGKGKLFLYMTLIFIGVGSQLKGGGGYTPYHKSWQPKQKTKTKIK